MKDQSCCQAGKLHMDMCMPSAADWAKYHPKNPPFQLCWLATSLQKSDLHTFWAGNLQHDGKRDDVYVLMTRSTASTQATRTTQLLDRVKLAKLILVIILCDMEIDIQKFKWDMAVIQVDSKARVQAVCWFFFVELPMSCGLKFAKVGVDDDRHDRLPNWACIVTCPTAPKNFVNFAAFLIF